MTASSRCSMPATRRSPSASWTSSRVELRIVRLRPGLIFKREAGPEIRRLFAGPLLPAKLLKPGLIPVLPLPPGLWVQCVHAADVAEAYRLAATDRRPRRVQHRRRPRPRSRHAGPRRLRRGASRCPSARCGSPPTSASARICSPPRPAGWIWASPSPRWTRPAPARSSGGTPRHTSTEALLELLEGMRDPVGAPTPPLEPHAGGPARIKEFTTGVGQKLTAQR